MKKYELIESFRKSKEYDKFFDDFILSRCAIEAGSKYNRFWISTFTGHRFYRRIEILQHTKRYYKRYINILRKDFEKCVQDRCIDVQNMTEQLKLEL